YMSAVEQAGADSQLAAQAEPQADYLRSLLAFTAERAGFAGPTQGNEPAATGIALLDKSGRTVPVPPPMPAFQAPIGVFLASVPAGPRGVSDLFLDGAGRPAMAFAVPVYAVQSEAEASAEIGRIVGIKEVAGDLYPLLKQPGAAEASAEAVLVRRSGDAIE